jgi:hypothetical protein
MEVLEHGSMSARCENYRAEYELCSGAARFSEQTISETADG